MIKFSRDKVLLLHQIISAETGGDPELRDINLLDSALESAFQTFDGQELYPTKEEKAARIGYARIPFCSMTAIFSKSSLLRYEPMCVTGWLSQ